MAGLQHSSWWYVCATAILNGRYVRCSLCLSPHRLSAVCLGSGSTYLFGHMDATFKHGMTKEECLKWAAEAITLAIERDGSSGGVVRLAAITKDGVERHVTPSPHEAIAIAHHPPVGHSEQ